MPYQVKAPAYRFAHDGAASRASSSLGQLSWSFRLGDCRSTGGLLGLAPRDEHVELCLRPRANDGTLLDVQENTQPADGEELHLSERDDHPPRPLLENLVHGLDQLLGRVPCRPFPSRTRRTRRGREGRGSGTAGRRTDPRGWRWSAPRVWSRRLCGPADRAPWETPYRAGAWTTTTGHVAWCTQ